MQLFGNKYNQVGKQVKCETACLADRLPLRGKWKKRKKGSGSGRAIAGRWGVSEGVKSYTNPDRYCVKMKL